MCLEWVVASTHLGSCVLGKKCVILLFQKEYAGLRVNASIIIMSMHIILLLAVQLNRKGQETVKNGIKMLYSVHYKHFCVIWQK